MKCYKILIIKNLFISIPIHYIVISRFQCIRKYFNYKNKQNRSYINKFSKIFNTKYINQILQLMNIYLCGHCIMTKYISLNEKLSKFNTMLTQHMPFKNFFLVTVKRTYSTRKRTLSSMNEKMSFDM